MKLVMIDPIVNLIRDKDINLDETGCIKLDAIVNQISPLQLVKVSPSPHHTARLLAPDHFLRPCLPGRTPSMSPQAKPSAPPVPRLERAGCRRVC